MAKRNPLEARGSDDDALRLAALTGVAVGLDQGRTALRSCRPTRSPIWRSFGR